MTIQRQLVPGDPPWLELAFAEVGVKELNPGDSPRIVEYHKHTSLGATTDETPWCSSFCCFVMEKEEITSTNSAASLSWLRWGRILEKPVRGCIVVFERLDPEGTPIPHRGHCGFWLGEQSGEIVVLGGNQSNRVSVQNYPAGQVLGYRWPARPINSTTNIASVTAAAGTVATVAPSVVKVLDSVESSTDQVLTISDRVAELIGRILSAPDSLISVAGILLTLAALWHIVRERNKKMKRLGV